MTLQVRMYLYIVLYIANKEYDIEKLERVYCTKNEVAWIEWPMFKMF